MHDDLLHSTSSAVAKDITGTMMVAIGWVQGHFPMENLDPFCNAWIIE